MNSEEEFLCDSALTLCSLILTICNSEKFQPGQIEILTENHESINATLNSISMQRKFEFILF